MKRKSIALVLMAMIACDSLAVASTKSKVVSIAEARALSSGTVVTVEGTVTVPSGAFKSSLNDEGFAIQDASGGIYVGMSASRGLRVGRRVRVTGRLTESNGMLVIAPSGSRSIKVQGRGREVRPRVISTGKVDELTEGLLVKVEGTMTRPVSDDAPYGFRFFLNDGTGEIQIFVSASTGIHKGDLQPGARLVVTGFSAQYKDHYEVDPRFSSDISLLP